MPASSSPTVFVHVVRVFCDAEGAHGNPLGVVLSGETPDQPAVRQTIARELGFSETVFVDDETTGAIKIFTPERELPLAGHPLVGTAWLLAQRGTPVAHLLPPAGQVPCAADATGAWIDAVAAWAPPFRMRQLETAADVEALDAAAEPSDGLDYVWAWSDRAAGRIRARSFGKAYGIVEDEATGSAALRLCAALSTDIEIHQGLGSRIRASPRLDGRVRVSGHVVAAEPVIVRQPD